MKLVDANLLLYAVNEDAPRHGQARRWLEGVLSGRESVGFCWPVLMAFLRLSTSPVIFPRPLDVVEAFGLIDSWLERPNAVLVHPTPRHLSLLRELLEPLGVAGNLSTDAHLAALAIEHGAVLCSTDHDFARFPQLSWENPLASRQT